VIAITRLGLLAGLSDFHLRMVEAGKPAFFFASTLDPFHCGAG